MYMIECDTCPDKGATRVFTEDASDFDSQHNCGCPDEITAERPFGKTLTITALPGSATILGMS